jgi:tRNA U34 5-methylaminomethyl-2-thiouridine-forming methyltransferase MnmC
MKHLQILTTKDNSVTIYNTELNETYHSKHGAVQESLHVFIKNGLHFAIQQFPDKELSILEIGFGTGLNALLTLLENEKLSRKINYTSTEPFPLSMEIVKELNYGQVLNLKGTQHNQFIEMHKSRKLLTENFNFELITNEFMSIDFTSHFDIIYFDAFAPDKQANLWTKEVFEKCKALLNNNGLIVTYCAKGEVKRTIKACNLKLETLNGPPGKREMIRAIKSNPSSY